MKSKLNPVSVRLNDELYARLEKAKQIGRYKLSFQQLVERGLELAIKELEDDRDLDPDT